MRDVIAQLRSRNQPVPHPLPRPTLGDIQRVEAALGMSLPADFVTLQLGAGDVVVGTLEPVTVSAGSGHTEIVGVAIDAWAAGVPKSWLPVCESNGDYYCLLPSGEVRFWSHDGVTSERWSSLESWVEAVWLNGA